MRNKVLAMETLQIDEVQLDIKNGRLIRSNRTHHLRPIECRLLEILMLHPGQVVTRASLMKEVWETDYLDDTRTLDVHMCLLRKKLEEDPQNPRYLRTKRGVGYTFCA